MRADKILFHPHYIGELMSDSKGKTVWHYFKHGVEIRESAFNKMMEKGEYEGLESKQEKIPGETLSDTCKKRLIKVFVEAKYGRESNLENKYIKKGLQTEEDAITLYSRINKTIYFKNVDTISNEFLIGTPDFGDKKDIRQSKVIIDTKSCWDLFTFWQAKTTTVNKDYYWQMQSYLDLTGAEKGVITYCLVNTPEPLIYDEKKKLQWKMGVINPEADKLFQQACDELDKAMKYDDIPMNERMFEIQINRNDEDINRLYERIKQCREYMNRHLFIPELEEIEAL